MAQGRFQKEEGPGTGGEGRASPGWEGAETGEFPGMSQVFHLTVLPWAYPAYLYLGSEK